MDQLYNPIFFWLFKKIVLLNPCFMFSKNLILSYRKSDYQGFPNRGRGGGRNQKFYWGDFFTRWMEPKEEWFWQFEPFSKLKTAFREYWTSVKIKINMTWVSKEYKIKIKMEQEQWLPLKMLFLLGYNLKKVV